MNRKQVFILVLLIGLVGCSVNINPTKCDINVKQGSTDIQSGSGYFNFGNIPLNASQVITFTIENTGLSDLTLTGSQIIEITGADTDSFILRTYLTQRTIASNDTTAFAINFKPKSIGKKTANVVIQNNDKDENPYTFVITGTSTAPAPEIHVKQGNTDILCTTGSFDFGNVAENTSSTPVVFTIENNGNETLILSGSTHKVSVIGTHASMFIVDDTATQINIPGKSSTTFKIIFHPTSAGIKIAKVTILSNDSDENPYIFDITGTSHALPEIAVYVESNLIQSGGSYDFGAVRITDSSPEITFTIKNVGFSTLQLPDASKAVEISDSSLFTLHTTSIDEYIAPGNSTTFGVVFSPDSVPEKTAKISITSNDDDENPYVINLKGSGGLPEINIKQGSNNILDGSGVHDFGSVMIGKSGSPVTFTIENLGIGDLNLTVTPKILISGPESTSFIIDDSATSTPILYSQSTTFTITFAPVIQNLCQALITIGNDDRDENPYSFSIRGYGLYSSMGVSQNSYNIPHNVGQFDFGSYSTGNSSPDLTFTITNYGSGDLELNGSPKIQISGTDASMFSINQTSTNTPVSSYGGTTTFNIKFTPTSIGKKYATITIPNNSYYASPYVFTITGSTEGVAIGWIGGAKDGWQTGNAPSYGAADYQSFDAPQDVFIDYTGHVFVADTLNHRVCKWDLTTGNAIAWIGTGGNGWTTSTAPAGGYDFRSFSKPVSVFVDNGGYIYVADRENHRISKWNHNGHAIGWIGCGYDGWQTSSTHQNSTDYKSFNVPRSVFVDGAGNIYVADTENHRICKWYSNGTAFGWIGGGSNGWKTGAAPSIGSDYQSFKYPEDVFVDSAGNIYVADRDNHRICKWSSSGIAIGFIGRGVVGWQTSGSISNGNGYDYFNVPRSVYVDSAGTIFVSEFANHRISKWSSTGSPIGWIGSGLKGWIISPSPLTHANGVDYQRFNNPIGLYVSTTGYIFVADTYNHRISKWID